MGDKDMEPKSSVEHRVLKYLAKNGMSTQYKMIKHRVGAERSILKSVEKLAKNEHIELKKQEPFKKIGGKTKKYYGLTFKGLIYTLEKGFIKPSQAHNVRIKNNTSLPFVYKLPKLPGIFPCLDVRSEEEIVESNRRYLQIIESIERHFPSIFYRLFAMVDMQNIRQFIEILGFDDAEGVLVAFTGTFTIFLLSLHKDYCTKYLKDGTLYLPDGAPIGDFSKIEAIRSVFFKHTQDILKVDPFKMLSELLKYIKI
ncbi:MAG: hypothetical protein QXZ25_06240 [Candidatus Bathyarchaeia archaeon]